METLLTLVGLGDPYGTGLGEGMGVAGPVLRALGEGRFTRLLLLAPLGRETRAEALRKELVAHAPDCRVTVEALGCGEEDALGLVAGILGAEDLRVREGSMFPGHMAAVATPAAPAWFAAWLVLSSGALKGVALLDARLEVYPDLDDDDPTAGRQREGGGSVLREPLATYGTATSRVATEDSDEKTPFREARRLGLHGEHARLREAVEAAAAVAAHQVPVLIQGETGTGKSLFARLIHELGDRRDGPFVAVNCAALPEKLVESTLFGHRRGAFTGATDHQEGKFTLADGGTLFLDELGDLQLDLQSKLLKVLDDRIVEPVGATKGHRVDTRVLAATNRDLRQDIAEGRFREDLYYRIAFGLIHLPPLRERPEDIPPIALHLLDRINASMRSPKSLTREALCFLQGHPWPGNVRDLENVIGRSALMSKGDTLGPDDLLLDAGAAASPQPASLPEPHDTFSLEGFLVDARRTLIRRALELTHGNQSAAARKLGLSPQAVSKFVQREGL